MEKVLKNVTSEDDSSFDPRIIHIGSIKFSRIQKYEHLFKNFRGLGVEKGTFSQRGQSL